MLLYLCCIKKGLIYITIASLTNCQPLSCAECTKANIYSFCNVRSVFDTKYIYILILWSYLILIQFAIGFHIQSAAKKLKGKLFKTFANFKKHSTKLVYIIVI